MLEISLSAQLQGNVDINKGRL